MVSFEQLHELIDGIENVAVVGSWALYLTGQIQRQPNDIDLVFWDVESFDGFINRRGIEADNWNTLRNYMRKFKAGNIRIHVEIVERKDIILDLITFEGCDIIIQDVKQVIRFKEEYIKKNLPKHIIKHLEDIMFILRSSNAIKDN